MNVSDSTWKKHSMRHPTSQWMRSFGTSAILEFILQVFAIAAVSDVLWRRDVVKDILRLYDSRFGLRNFSKVPSVESPEPWTTTGNSMATHCIYVGKFHKQHSVD